MYFVTREVAEFQLINRIETLIVSIYSNFKYNSHLIIIRQLILFQVY